MNPADLFLQLDAIQDQLRAAMQKLATKDDFVGLPQMVTPDGETTVNPLSVFRAAIADKPEECAEALALAFALSGILVLISEQASKARALKTPKSSIILPGSSLT